MSRERIEAVRDLQVRQMEVRSAGRHLLGAGQPGEAGDVRQDGAIGARVFDGDEDAAVHGAVDA